MMLSEFTERTGFFPSPALYREIEGAYSECGLTKDEFCRLYKENHDGMAEAIARRACLSEIKAAKAVEAEKTELDAKIKHLKWELEEAGGWAPYESPNNVSQADYENLSGAGGTRVLTDEEAKDLIKEEFGFDRSKITILHSVAKEEVSLRRHIRKSGEVERLPVYNATDWNYIRFDCCNWFYEMHNGTLRPFFQ